MASPPAQDDDKEKPSPYKGQLIEDGWEAMQGWTSNSTGNGWHLIGKCPHCQHDVDKYLPIEVTVSGAGAEELALETDEYTVLCNCTGPHSDQPKDESGCGAYWGVKIAHQASGPKVVGPAEVGPGTLRWEKKAEDLEYNALSNIRGTAEKWAATLTAILGLAGTVLIARGADEIAELSDGTQRWVIVLLLIALAAAVFATVSAAHAAQGTPQSLKWPNALRLRNWEHERAKEAKAHLKRSRRAAIVAVTAIAFAVGVSWFESDDSGDEGGGATVLFTPATGQPLCGTLVNGANGLELEVDKEERVALPPGPYGQAVPVDGCPKEKEAEGESAADQAE